MARMSIDDSFLRDPKVLRLAKRVGWSRRETMGALLDVWAVAYDRATAVLPAEDIDIAAQHDNFACDMVVVGLATQTENGMRITGAEARVNYLTVKAEAGRKGGFISGISRAKVANAESKQCFDNAEAPANPIPTPIPTASPIPSPRPEGERHRGKLVRRSPETAIPAEWHPTPEHSEIARERGADLDLEARKFRLHAEANDRRCVRWNAAFSQWLLKASPERHSNGHAQTEIRMHKEL